MTSTIATVIKTQEELDKIIELHDAWLMGKPEGVRADLNEYSIFGCDLSHKNLSGASMDYTMFVNCNLTESVLVSINSDTIRFENCKIDNMDIRGNISTNIICTDSDPSSIITDLGYRRLIIE